MFSFLLRRVVAIFPIVFIVSVISFGIVNVLPGDVALAILGENQARNEDAYQRVRKELGLDRPVLDRYIRWVGSALSGDLGKSFRTNEPVLSGVVRRLGPTTQLALMSVVIAVVIGVPLGILSAVYRGRLLDNISTLIALWGVAMPNFWLGIILIYVFSVWLRWLPPSGFVPIFEDPMTSLRLLLMPSIALSTGLTGVILRQTRSSMLEVLGEDFVRTARSKGLSAPSVLWKHALRNALVPIVTVIGMQLGRLVGGTVTVELVFSIPGMGRLAADTIYFRDFPVLQGIMLITALAVLLASLVTDIIYSVVDPRIQYG